MSKEEESRSIYTINILFSVMSMLAVSDLSKTENGKPVIDSISFDQQSFEKIAIAGETGAGKTSLLKMIAGLMQPDTGNILFNGEKVVGPFEKLLPGHPGIAYLSQYFELRNHYWVHEILEYANQLEPSSTQLLYSVCRITHLLQRRTDQLSGGERQRITLARLLSTSPKLLLLDEPFSNLDALHKPIIKSVIRDIGEKLGITCMLVAHDPADMLSWADRILILKNGRIVQDGKPVSIYRQPANEYVAGLFGDYNLVDANQEFFSRLELKVPSNKKLFLRPDNFVVAENEQGEIPATVQSIIFWGTHSTVDVWVGNNLVRVRHTGRSLAEGEHVTLRFENQDPWYI